MAQEQIAILAGGCFWCTEPVFSQLAGVQAVTSGYIGGEMQHPSYEAVCQGNTGHAEAVRIVFNADVIPYETLLCVFLMAHNPTTLNRQGNDVGTQYRSAIFYLDAAQMATARKVIAQFEDGGIYENPIVTAVVPAPIFYPAEDYHQYYFANNPNQPYCLAMAVPKMEKIRQLFPDFIVGEV